LKVRTGGKVERDRTVMLGTQLKQNVRLAMAEADIPSLSALARQSHVQRDTLYAWFRGDHPPKSSTLEKVAGTLGIRLGDLWDYETERPTPTADARLLAEIREAVADGVETGLARLFARQTSPGRMPPPRQLQRPE
jgi:transcriptional regulator with XRE-family HTH domain